MFFCVSAVSTKKTASRANTFGRLIEKFSSVSQKRETLISMESSRVFKWPRHDNDRLSLSISFVDIQFCHFFLGLKQLEEEKNFKLEFPPCNVEYKADPGTTRFWCSTVSVKSFWVI